MSYLKRSGNRKDFKDLSIVMKDEDAKALVAAMLEAQETGRNALGLACCALYTLRDLGYNVQTKPEV